MPSLKTLKKEELYADLLKTIDKEYALDTSPELGSWAVKEGILLDGRPFSFNKHEYLIEPYADRHPFQVEIKATQLGLTSKALLKTVYYSRYGGDKFRGIGYYFPSKSDVTDLSKIRLTALIEDNPNTIGSWLKETDAANVKKIWNTALYLRGMRSRVGMKGAPMDFVIFDELDEAPQKSVDMIMERMAHSDAGEALFLSNPTLPDYGIDALFQTTDMQFWLLRCSKCNHHTNLVETFPDCLVETRGGVIRACQKCGAELDPSRGSWVAKRPQITERRGRQYSQLFSQSKMTTPEAILQVWRTTSNRTDFFNLKIGIAYVEAQNRLSVKEVLDCCGDKGMASSSEDGTFMGVDQGSNLHIVIGKPSENRMGEVIHVAVLKGTDYNDPKDESGWKELDSFMNRFRVIRCVVDALPNTKFARNFAERHPGRVYLNFYNEYQKGSLKWNDKELIVQGNRTETLDASHNLIVTQSVVLPRQSDMMEDFAKHLHNVAKKLEEDEDTGSQRYVYIKLGEDHFRHAFNYWAMCLLGCPEFMFADMM